MLPGISSVLRRDRRGNEPPQSPTSSGSSPRNNGHSGGGGASSSSNSGSIGRQTAAAAVVASAREAAAASAAAAARGVPMPVSSALQHRASGDAPMLPEEMRARERERQSRANAPSSSSNHPSGPREQQAGSSHMRRGSGGGSQSGSDAGSARYSSQHMESSVTRLLVATKMLLESLTKWSLGQRTENEVSDIYVRLGNDFNTANVAFGSYGIDMSDLASVPDDLRVCLERCLSEDASPQILEVHLPRIREIIINLLQGLKAKQAEYKRFIVSQRSGGAGGGGSGQPRDRESLRRSMVRSDRLGVSESAPATQQEPEALVPDAASRPEHPARSSTTGAPTRRSQTGSIGRRPANAPPLDRPASRTSQDEAPSSRSAGKQRAAPPEALSSMGRSMMDAVAVGDEADEARDSLTGEVEMPEKPQAPRTVQRHSLVDTPMPTLASTSTLGGSGEDVTLPSATSASSFAAVSTPPPHSAPASRVSSARSNARRAANAANAAAAEAEADPSLRALKSRDALERRASKRFSAYTFNKMGVGVQQGFGMGSLAMSGLGTGTTNSPTHSPLADRKGAQRGSGASRRLGASMLSAGDASSGDERYNVGRSSAADTSSQEAIEELTSTSKRASGNDEMSRRPTPPARRASPATSSRQGEADAAAARLALPSSSGDAGSSTESLPYVDAAAPGLSHASPRRETLEFVPPVPPLPTPEERKRLDAAQARGSVGGMRLSASPNIAAASLPTSGSLNVFLQLGRQTRKGTLQLDPAAPARGLTIAKLRMLFIDRFSYSPGKEDFPTIYVKDPSSGVRYELEDFNELGEGALLTLNIEPLDQVKQHLDLSIGAITRELRELKVAVYDRDREAARRASTNYGASIDTLAASSIPAPTSRITDSQFTSAGARVALLKRANTVQQRGEEHDGTVSPAMSTGSAGSAGPSGAKIASELKTQYDEVQSLRREMAVLRQIQGDFNTDVGGLLSGLREQSSRVRAIASAEVPTERNFIVAGKAKLDGSSQEVLTLVEDLQDTVDDLKQDVIQRGVKPKPAAMKKMGEDIARATRGLEELEKYVETVKPSWKKTWEAELQNIVDEQEFLNHQEGLIADLRDDHGALQEVYENIQQVVKLRGVRPIGSGNRGYLPPPPEEGHDGLNTVMLEVRSQSVDHDKRLKALAAAEKSRAKQIASQSDDFTDELQGFVDGKALRKTGGHIEAERIRARRDQLTMKAMFSGGADSVGGAPAVSSNKPPPKLRLGSKDPAEDGEGSVSSPAAAQGEETFASPISPNGTAD